MIDWLLNLFKPSLRVGELYFYNLYKESVEAWEYETVPVFEITRVGKNNIKGNLYKTLDKYRSKSEVEICTMKKKFFRESYVKVNYKSKHDIFSDELKRIIDEKDNE